MEAFLLLFLTITCCYIFESLNKYLLRVFSLLPLILLIVFLFKGEVYSYNSRYGELFSSSYTFDYLSASLLPIISLLSFAFLKDFDLNNKNWKLTSLVLAGFISVFLNDPILFLLFFEATSFFGFLIGYKGEIGRSAALRFIKYSIFSFSSLLISYILYQKDFQEMASLLLFLGTITKAPLFPFTSWQVQAYTECFKESVLAMSALVSKLPFLFILRFGSYYNPNDIYLIFSGLATFLSAFNIIRAKELPAQLALASSTHFGIFLCALQINHQLAYQISPIFFMGHGVLLGYLIYLSKISQKPELSTGGIIGVLGLLGQPFGLLFWSDISFISIIFQKSVWICTVSAFSLVIISWLGIQILRDSILKIKVSTLDIIIFLAFILGFMPKTLQPEINFEKQEKEVQILTDSI